MENFIQGLMVLLALGFFGVHLFRIWSFYIEFDGKDYWVWERKLLGYNSAKGYFSTEEDAHRCIERLHKNPPRIINP